MLHRAAVSRSRRGLISVAALVAAALVTSVAAAQSTTDPRATLTPGLNDAGVAAAGIELLKNTPKAGSFVPPDGNPGNFGFVNSDLAFEGKHAFVGNFNGFQIYDISNPSNPTLVTQVVCPGGQGEVSVYKNLLFMSAEETRARTDCGSPGVPTGDPLRFRGVRVFDISNIAAPVQVAAVQTCRGSHTHTLLKSKHDDANVYVYVNGTGGVRSTTEMASCKALPPGTPLSTPQFDNDLSQWRIEVIKIPLAAPHTAAVVGQARLMGDPATGQINVLQNANPTPLHPSGTPWGPSPTSDSCHDITVFPALDIAAGACEGNGLLIDISDPANPRRTAVAQDNLFAYWHGATFTNDGKTVVFTDEWGGGTAPRCRATDSLSWGANAIYDIVGGELVFRSYYKLPVAQTNQENCVSHIPSLVPVPGRDIMVQAWYQGGASLIDFTDSANPVEIGYWDRGPISSASLVLGGLWSTYWYNGEVYGSEIARGFDSFKLTPTDQLSANEIEAAGEVVFDRLTPQHQPQYVNEASFAVVRAYRDQLVRAGLLKGQKLENVDKYLDRAERAREDGKDAAARAYLRSLAFQLQHEGDEFETIVEALFDLAEK